MMRTMLKRLLLASVLLLACKKNPDLAAIDGGPLFNAPPTDGGATQEEVMKVIRAVRPQMEKCYDDAVAKKPTLQGKIVLLFAIGTDGRVDPKRAGLGGEAGDPVFAQCVLDVVVKQQFPAPKIATDVQLPMDLSKRKDAGVPAPADAAHD